MKKQLKKNIIWKNKIITRYKVTILKTAADNLKQHEQFLLDYFIQHIASIEQTFYIDEIESFSKKHKKIFINFGYLGKKWSETKLHNITFLSRHLICL